MAARYAILFGEYELTIDEKNRMLVPAEVRKALVPERDGEAFFLVMGVNRMLWMYPEKYYEELVAQDPTDILPGEEALAFDQMHFGMTSRLEWDKQGRVLIPEKTLRRTDLKRDVTLIGVRDHLELWDRDEWNTHREELLNRRAEVALKAKQARLQPPG